MSAGELLLRQDVLNAFREEWHKADRENVPGERVARGLDAALAAMAAKPEPIGEYIVVRRIDVQTVWNASITTVKAVLPALKRMGLAGDEKDNLVPGRWWRSIEADGELWGESSDEEEIREMARPTDKIQRLWVVPGGTTGEWRDE